MRETRSLPFAPRWALCIVLAGTQMALQAAPAPAASPPLSDWPRVQSAVPLDPAIEARIQKIVAGMTLAQKVGQMTQPDIRYISPADVGRYYIGSVLNGGGAWPDNNKNASVADWLAGAEAYHAASMSTDAATPIPLLWGTDAVHGHGNVFGATLFPHNIGLGAAGDAALVEQIGAATAKAVRATGIRWVFAPTLAVAANARWGRTYESFSADPRVVARMGAASVRGLQGDLKDDAKVLATAKHFIGDGSTEHGRDQGLSKTSRADMINVHSQGYFAAIAAGVQAVMVSFHSWRDEQAGTEHGKLHGSRLLLTEVLKNKIGFDGLLVSDWDGIGQVPGCSPASCAQAINAGIDLVMVPEQWRAFIGNTMAQVASGEIALARIDDAVSRVLRVKLRAGLFEKSPAQGVWAGKAEALQARELARRAVRQSLVLLKNNRATLPLAQGKRILVVGKSANNLSNQTGGWSLTWQGTNNQNKDFPAAQSVLDGIREVAGAAELSFSESGQGVDVQRFDAVIAVIGETPYAEGVGDIVPSSTLRHSARHAEDLVTLQRVSGHGVPLISVFIAGRTLYTNDLLNLSDAFVVAWLPGTEGGGVADLLFKNARRHPAFDFAAKLPFAWPATDCATLQSAPLFKLGYGLSYAKPGKVALLDTRLSRASCDASTELLIFRQTGQNLYQLGVSSLNKSWPGQRIGNDLNAIIEVPSERPAIRVSTAQINTQQDAKRLAWAGPAGFFVWSAQRADLTVYPQAALVFDLLQEQAPTLPVGLSMACGNACAGKLELNRVLAGVPLSTRQTLKIPLTCFALGGADLSRIDMPFGLTADAPFTASLANIRIVAGAALDADAIDCTQLGVLLKP
jgi:beta-glucosidase